MSAIEASSVSVKTMAGREFGALTVLKMSQAHDRWVCLCKCGTFCTKNGRTMRYGSTRSCGCQQLAPMQSARKAHGARRSPDPELRRFYAAWSGMRARCSNPNHKDFKHYGGAGVTVCKRWGSFENFKADMWPRPNGMTLDRKNPFKGYSPDNCRWATHKEQRHNRRDNHVSD